MASTVGVLRRARNREVRCLATVDILGNTSEIFYTMLKFPINSESIFIPYCTPKEIEDALGESDMRDNLRGTLSLTLPIDNSAYNDLPLKNIMNWFDNTNIIHVINSDEDTNLYIGKSLIMDNAFKLKVIAGDVVSHNYRYRTLLIDNSVYYPATPLERWMSKNLITACKKAQMCMCIRPLLSFSVTTITRPDLVRAPEGYMDILKDSVEKVFNTLNIL